LRAQENERYGIASAPSAPKQSRQQSFNNARQNQRSQGHFPAPITPTPAMQAQRMTENSRLQPPVANPQQQEIPVPTITDEKFSGLEVFQDPQSYKDPIPSAPTPRQPQVAPQPQQVMQQPQVANQVPQGAVPADFESQKTSVVAPPVAPSVENVFFYDEANDIAYTLTGAVEKIGRESTNDIVVSDINASRTHAEIHMEPSGQWIISDLGSTNGLYVNGNKVQSAILNDADIVLIGTTRLEFQNL
jgi:pSer/pThr/pTyr-binding forkhead associated (FHA) protein